ncbi:GtrA family protein [Defluviimonas aestuarii]|uniref:GtrA family protein n=1 Tax=Albidovulum aestuarii TaxID=1130726 RepID=UPI00249CB930|nr:GtrA family protein [Defluviimonas aestuarii]MDI3337227.1 GtrA family protein [Defluviimonas aestuarii]
MLHKLVSFVPPELRQFALYVICGGSGVALDFGLYSALVASGTWHHAANIAGYAAGTLLSFVLNRAITFGVMDAALRRLAIFFGVAGLGYLSSTGVLLVLIDLMQVNPFLAKAASIIVVIAVQYTLNARVTFRRSE